MNSVHDVGGKMGLGSIDVEHDYKPFDEYWESISLAIMMECTFDWPVDRARYIRELSPERQYFSDLYFASWAMTYMVLLIENEHVGFHELISGDADEEPQKARSLTTSQAVEHNRAMAERYDQETGPEPRFLAGEQIKTVRQNHEGHCRLPNYASGKSGTIVTSHGLHIFPDKMADGEKIAHQLYTVAFSSRDLFGPCEKNCHTVMLDLWEPYLLPAGVGR